MTNQNNTDIASILGQRVSSPDTYSPDILRKEPRQSNRSQYGITEGYFEDRGYDIWNNWEASFLLNNGRPVTGISKILFDANSEFLIESKSLKLYFNSFNMEKLGDTVEEARRKFIELSEKDLTIQSGKPVKVVFFTFEEANSKIDGSLVALFDNSCNLDNQELNGNVDCFNENPDLLKIEQISNSEVPYKRYYSSLLRSNCKITNAPDTGDLYIAYEVGADRQIITDESLLRYILSFRKENHFHEECCEMIYKRLFDALQPKVLLVACFYNRRGSLDINAVRYNAPINDLDLSTDFYLGSLLHNLGGYCTINFSDKLTKAVRQ